MNCSRLFTMRMSMQVASAVIFCLYYTPNARNGYSLQLHPGASLHLIERDIHQLVRLQLLLALLLDQVPQPEHLVQVFALERVGPFLELLQQ